MHIIHLASPSIRQFVRTFASLHRLHVETLRTYQSSTNSQATSGRFRDRGVRLGGFTGFLSRVERAATWCPTEVVMRHVLFRIYLVNK